MPLAAKSHVSDMLNSRLNVLNDRVLGIFPISTRPLSSSSKSSPSGWFTPSSKDSDSVSRQVALEMSKNHKWNIAWRLTRGSPSSSFLFSLLYSTATQLHTPQSNAVPSLGAYTDLEPINQHIHVTTAYPKRKSKGLRNYNNYKSSEVDIGDIPQPPQHYRAVAAQPVLARWTLSSLCARTTSLQETRDADFKETAREYFNLKQVSTGELTF